MEFKIGHPGYRSAQKSVLNFNMMARMMVGMMVGISAGGLTTRAPAVTPPTQNQTTVQMGHNQKGTLDPSVPPSTAEWGRFMRLGQQDASRLWNDYRHKGYAFGKWHWKWRLGWIRVCREAMAVEPAELSTICPSILDQAFTDRALVVRAEAVSTLGQIHDGSGDAGISKKLLEATTDPRNRRKNTPVMVQRRALYAIKKIGHPEYVKAAAAAAAKDPALNEYWQKLELARSGASKP